jgi:hypothetical protein
VACRVVFGIGVAGVVDLAALVDIAVEVDDVVVGDVQPVPGVARPGLQLAQVLARIGARLERLALVVQGDVGDGLAMRLGRIGRGAALGGDADDAPFDLGQGLGDSDSGGKQQGKGEGGLDRHCGSCAERHIKLIS